MKGPLADSQTIMAFLAARYDEADVMAIKALAEGNAGPSQQKRALEWIIHKAARTFDEPFIPGHADVTANMTGRRSVGLQIIKLVNVPVSILLKQPDGTNDS